MHHVEDWWNKNETHQTLFPHCKTQPEEGWKVNVTDSSPKWSQRRGLVCPDVVPPLKECAATINIRINAAFICFSKPVFNVLPRLAASCISCKTLWVENHFIHRLQQKSFSFPPAESQWHFQAGASLTSPLVLEFLLWTPLNGVFSLVEQISPSDLPHWNRSVRLSSSLTGSVSLSFSLHSSSALRCRTHSCLSSPVE